MIYHDEDVRLADGQSLLLVPWGDAQSEEEFDRLTSLMNWLTERERLYQHQVRLFGLGDYFEAPSPSDTAALRSAKRGFGMYDDLMKNLDQTYGERADKMAQILKPQAHNIVTMLTGHHVHQFSGLNPAYPDKISTDEYLAKQLGTKFVGDGAVVITFNINGLPFGVFASHGYGSARTPGARLTKRLRMRDVYGAAHWYVMGHDDEKVVYPLEALQPDRSYLKQYFSGSGSFQRGYELGNLHASYVEKLLLAPNALGVVICTVKLEEKHGQPRLDYHISV